MTAKKRVLLVGGAGTLGSDILDANLKDYEICVVDNFSESALTENEVREKVQYFNISVADELATFNAFEKFKPHDVIYLATTLSKDPRRAYESNLLGMLNSIKAAEQTNQPRVIYVQSFLTRNCDEIITSESPVVARDYYSTWKLAAEHILTSYSGVKTTWILGSVLSPRLSIGAIPAFIRRLQNNESIKVANTYRDYISPEIFIKGLLQILDNIVHRDVLVLGSGNPKSTVEILEKTATALGIEINRLEYEVTAPNFSDPQVIRLDNSDFIGISSQEKDFIKCIQNITAYATKSSKKIRLHH